MLQLICIKASALIVRADFCKLCKKLCLREIMIILKFSDPHCLKSVRIRSYSGSHFPAFGLNTESNGVSLRIHSKYGKMWTRITPNKDIFYAVQASIVETNIIILNETIENVLSTKRF